jgi:hypothetical protein
MSSSKVIMVMAMLILIFLFGGLMLGFILQSQGVLEKQSGRVVVNDETTMAQMATHVALRAYNCDDNGGGHFSAADAIDFVPAVDGYKHWEDWQDYLEYAEPSKDFHFQDLKEATPGNLQCSGTGSSLPLTTDGFLNKLGGAVTASHFGNDQEGRYGRMEFVVNKTIRIGGDGEAGIPLGCYGLDHSGPDKLTNMYIGVADEDDLNIFEFDNGLGSGKECHAIGDPSETINVDGSGAPQQATLLTWTIIGDKESVPADSDIWNSGELETGAFRICEGATGYIQANTGGDSMAEPTGSEYSLQDTPGGNGEQEGGSILSGNKVRLFMVVEGGDDC